MSDMICVDCGEPITRVNARQLRCSACAANKKRADNRQIVTLRRDRIAGRVMMSAVLSQKSPCDKCPKRAKYQCDRLVRTLSPLPCMPEWEATPNGERARLARTPASHTRRDAHGLD